MAFHSQTFITNASDDPTRMVLDLNGHRFYAHAQPPAGPEAMTIISSTGHGTFETGTITMASNAVVGPNVTIEMNGGGSIWRLGAMDRASRLLISGANRSSARAQLSATCRSAKLDRQTHHGFNSPARISSTSRAT